MIQTPLDIAALEAQYQQAYKDWPGSIERIGIVRRQFVDALLTAAPELIKAAKERDGWRAKSREWNLLYQTQAHSDAMMIRSLRALLAEAGEIMKAYKKWEADLVINGDWSRGCVLMNQAQHDRMVELQSMRARIDTSIQSALREIPTSDAKPLDFP